MLTKADLLKKLEGVTDYAIMNFSVDEGDIARVESLRVAAYPFEDKPEQASEFCLVLA